jgi:hypothetical protein
MPPKLMVLKLLWRLVSSFTAFFFPKNKKKIMQNRIKTQNEKNSKTQNDDPAK